MENWCIENTPENRPYIEKWWKKTNCFSGDHKYYGYTENYGKRVENYYFGKELTLQQFLELTGQKWEQKVGEWVTLVQVPHGGYKVGDSAQIIRIIGDGQFVVNKKGTNIAAPECDFSCWRPATPEEIKQATMKDKEIIGYELIKEYPSSQKMGHRVILGTNLFKERYDSYPEFWKPIYKEEKKVIEVRCKKIRRVDDDAPYKIEEEYDTNFQVEVSKEGVYVPSEKVWVDVKELEFIIEPPKNQLCYHTKKSGSISIEGVWKVIYTHFDIGCHKQIPREDIEKVIQAYNDCKR